MLYNITMNLSKYLFIEGSKENLDIVLPGGSYGIDTPFMQKIINTCKKSGASVLAFNFPYFERGEENSSGPELKEEIETLINIMNKYKTEEFSHIRFVAKSLGAIVASYYLKGLNDDKHSKYSIVVLGYVTKSIDLSNFMGNITIIQGEFDKFGNIETVRDNLKNAKSKNISYFEVVNANHSYRNPETKEPVYENDAIKVLTSLK